RTPLPRSTRSPYTTLFRSLGPLLACAAATALSVIPISLYSLLTRGTLSYSGQTYLYAVYKDPEVMEFGFNAPIPTPFTFVRDNPDRKSTRLNSSHLGISYA